MNESNGMAESKKQGMSRTNRTILNVAFILLASAIGFAIWRDADPQVDQPAAQDAAAPSDQLAELEARTRREPNSADAWTALGAARFDMSDFAGAAAGAEAAPWEADLRRTIEQVGQIHKIDVAARLANTQARPLTANEMPVAARAIPGPSRADMEAASQLPKGQQDQMIQGMVSGLEVKLKANPADVDRWIMLMRSRMTLGETAKAAQALKDGIAANPAAAGRLKAQGQLLGVQGA